MTLRILALIFVSVSLSAGAQILFRFGMSAVHARSASPGDSAPSTLLLALTNPAVLGGFVAYGVSALLWLFVLARTEVSVAYPFVGLGFVITMLAGWWLLNEPITPLRVAGTLLVCIGVALIGTSASGRS
jgi:multidrug transporter EmrE-like cation transporter